MHQLRSTRRQRRWMRDAGFLSVTQNPWPSCSHRQALRKLETRAIDVLTVFRDFEDFLVSVSGEGRGPLRPIWCLSRPSGGMSCGRSSWDSFPLRKTDQFI